jgi:hypothetical protein
MQHAKPNTLTHMHAIQAMSTAYISKIKQSIKTQETETVHNDTIVGIIKTMQANQNTHLHIDLQLMGANIKTDQHAGKLN